MRKSLLIGGAIVAIGIVITVIVLSGVIEQEVDLVLSNYPKLFEKDVVIVIGENATQIEYEGAEAIAENLHSITGNMPVIKSDRELTEGDKAKYNLILVGSPNVNRALEEVYEITNATRITEEYPGENKGILEILRSPWNEGKALLLVEGSDELGVKAGSEMLMEGEKIQGRILTTMLKVTCLEELLKDTFDNKSVIVEGTVNEVEFYYGPPWLSFFIYEDENRLFVVGPFKVSSQGETGESLPVDKLRELMITHTTRVQGIYHDQEVFKERPYLTVTKIWIKTDTEYTLIWSYPLNNCPPLNKKEVDNQKI